MKKIYSIIIITLFYFSAVSADEAEQKRIYDEYNQKILNAGLEKNEEKYRELCDQYAKGKLENKIVGFQMKVFDGIRYKMTNSNNRLDYKCSGVEDGFYYGPAVYDLVTETNDKVIELRDDESLSDEEKRQKIVKVCKDWDNYNIEFWNYDATMLRIGDGIDRFCLRYEDSK